MCLGVDSVYLEEVDQRSILSSSNTLHTCAIRQNQVFLLPRDIQLEFAVELSYRLDTPDFEFTRLELKHTNGTKITLITNKQGQEQARRFLTVNNAAAMQLVKYAKTYYELMNEMSTLEEEEKALEQEMDKRREREREREREEEEEAEEERKRNDDAHIAAAHNEPVGLSSESSASQPVDNAPQAAIVTPDDDSDEISESVADDIDDDDSAVPAIVTARGGVGNTGVHLTLPKPSSSSSSSSSSSVASIISSIAAAHSQSPKQRRPLGQVLALRQEHLQRISNLLHIGTLQDVLDFRFVNQ